MLMEVCMKGKEETTFKKTLIFKRTKQCFKFAETDGTNQVEKSVLQRSLTQKVDYGEKNEASK